jgi:hypothetical protein
MTHKDIKVVMTFEEDMRPTVNMSITFDDAEDMGTYLNKLKEFWEDQLREIKAQEILDKMKEKK